MVTVTNAVEKILFEDAFVIRAMQRGLLNISAYAKEIHKEVEEKTFKPVQRGTIVVALLRIADKIRPITFIPKVVIEDFTITSFLTEIAYEKTAKNIAKLAELDTRIMEGGKFFTVTEGLHEIMIICANDVLDRIIRHFYIEPKVVIHNLIAVSIRFSPEYIHTPNMIYALVSELATKQINIVEIVSTYTEMTFVVDKNVMEQIMQVLHKYQKSK